MTHFYRLIPLIIAGIVLTGIISAIAEEVTLTTYYPAPTGEYNDLEAGVLTLTPGSVPPVATNSELEGMFYYDDGTGSNTEGLYYCEANAGGWTLLGGGAWTKAASGTDIYYTGKVGIGGATTPSHQLHIKGTGAATDGIRVSATGTLFIPKPGQEAAKNTFNARGLSITEVSRTITNSYQPNVGIAVAVNQTEPAVALKNTNGPALVTEEGYVGIGAFDPQRQLHIYNPGTIFDPGLVIDAPVPTLVLKEYDEGTDEKYWTYKAANGIFYGYVANDLETSFIPWLVVGRTGTTVDKVAFPNGNVGIGTNAPTKKLDVSGIIRANGIILNPVDVSTVTGENGMLICDSTDNKVKQWDATAGGGSGGWVSLAAATPNISQSEGYFRIGDVQVCWGPYVPSPEKVWSSRTTNFPQAFKDTTYQIVAHTYSKDTHANVEVDSKSTDSFRNRSYYNHNPSPHTGTYIALGKWK